MTPATKQIPTGGACCWEGYSSSFSTAAKHSLKVPGVRHLFIDHPSAQHQLGDPFSQEKSRAPQPRADSGLRSGSEHSFLSGLFSSKVAPEPQHFYIAFSRKLHPLYLLRCSLSSHSAYLQVLSAFPKKPLRGQRDLKRLLSAVIATDQEMRIIHLLETLCLTCALTIFSPLQISE